MAIAFVQSAIGAGTTSATATLGATPTAGNILIAIARASTTAHGSHAMSGWTKVTSEGSVNRQASMWWKAVAGDAAAITFTGGGSDTNADLIVLEYSGVHTTAPVDVSATELVVTGTATTLGPVVTTVADTVIIAALALSNTSGGWVSWSNSFTHRQPSPIGTSTRLGAAGRIVSAAGSHSTDAVWTTSRNITELIAAFKAGGTTVSGTGAGTASTAGAASGTKVVRATAAAGTASTSGAATGKRVVAGTAAGTASTSGAATARRVVLATLAGVAATEGAATAVRIAQGTATGTAATAGTATGSTVRTGTAAGTTVTFGDATGLRVVLAVADGGTTTAGHGTSDVPQRLQVAVTGLQVRHGASQLRPRHTATNLRSRP